MPRIFISYRRDDSRATTGRIADRLKAAFGAENVLLDVYDIPMGVDFRLYLQNAIAQSDVVLIIIGKKWASILKERRNDPEDFVRIELESALEQRKITIPVLVDGAVMPISTDLPWRVQKIFPYLNAATIRDDPDFHTDMNKLIDSLPPPEEPTTIPNFRVVAGVVTAIAVLIIAILVTSNNLPPGNTPVSQLSDETQPVDFIDSPTETPKSTNSPTQTSQPTLTATLTSTPELTNIATQTTTETLSPTPTQTASPTSSPTETASPTQTLTVTAESPTTSAFIPVIETFQGYEFALVPAGEFNGNNLPEFWIMIYEVTNADFAPFVADNSNRSHTQGYDLLDTTRVGERISITGSGYSVDNGYENHPATRVTWYGASDFCESLGWHLPTAAQWQKAAVWNPATGESSNYPWGDDPPNSELANHMGTDTVQVGSYPHGRSAIGAYNMIGNASEWVADEVGNNHSLYGGSWDNATGLNAKLTVTISGRVGTQSSGFRCINEN